MACPDGKPKIPPQHTEKMASTWREKTAHIEKYLHRGPPPGPLSWNCFFHSLMPTPRASAYSSPLTCADHDLLSFYFICLRELKKKITKINQNQNFSGSFT